MASCCFVFGRTAEGALPFWLACAGTSKSRASVRACAVLRRLRKRSGEDVSPPREFHRCDLTRRERFVRASKSLRASRPSQAASRLLAQALRRAVEKEVVDGTVVREQLAKLGLIRAISSGLLAGQSASRRPIRSRTSAAKREGRQNHCSSDAPLPELFSAL